MSRRIDRTSRSDSTKTKRTKFVFDSSFDWKPVQSAKMRCDVVCLRNFQGETGCIVLNFLKSVLKVLRASGKKGTAIVQSRKSKSRNTSFGGLKRVVMAY